MVVFSLLRLVVDAVQIEVVAEVSFAFA